MKRSAAPIGRARDLLRQATRPDHEGVDRAYSRFDLKEIDGYRTFLVAMARAFIPIESALDRAGARDILPDWPARQRARLLRRDLVALGGELAEALPAPAFTGVPALLGGLYVIEGSRLGGAVLGRLLPPGSPAGFLTASAEPGGWRRLLRQIDETLFAPIDQAAAVEAAKASFHLFEEAAQAVADGTGRG